MTEQEIIKTSLFYKQFLTEKCIQPLCDMGICKELILSLSIDDINEIKDKNIFFNPIYSPASVSKINQDVKKGSRVITIDINSLKKYSWQESVAIILHEIGHAIHQTTDEFIADDAVNRGYYLHLISALEHGKQISPCEFNKTITEQRINKLKQNG